MKFNIKSLLWILLAAFLIGIIPGLNIRLNNESNNKSLILVADYTNFTKISNKSNIKFDDTLSRLKEAGVRGISIPEVSLYDLLKTGRADISTFGEFKAARMNDETLDTKIKDFISKDVNPESIVVFSNDDETIEFVSHGLSKRFNENEYTVIKTDNGTAFNFAADISSILDFNLGFDEELLNHVKDFGLEIVLRPSNSTNLNTSYIYEYDELIKKYNIKYLIFGGTEVVGFPNNLDIIKNIVKENKTIVGLIEAATQVKYLEQRGIDEFMADTGYPINRVYSILDNYLIKIGTDEMVFHWLRGVVDRNIRIIYIRPLDNFKLKYSENLDNTINSVKTFNEFITANGYSTDSPLQLLSSQMPGKIHYSLIALSLLIGGILYLLYLFDIDNKKYIFYLLGAGVIAIFGGVFILNLGLSKVFSLGAAILYPSLSSLLYLKYLKSNSNKPLYVQIPVSILLIIVVNAIGAVTILSSLTDIRFTMNVDIFKGVKIAFLTPLLLFVLNYTKVFIGFNKVRSTIFELLKYKVSYLAALLFGIVAVALYVYLARSGNSSNVYISPLELRLREILERVMIARPRFKEFIIGYPSIFMLAFLYKKFKNDLVAFLFGMAVMTGSISMVNSFCHVFTAGAVSASRTVNGLIFGVVLGLCAIVFLKVVLALFDRFIKIQSN